MAPINGRPFLDLVVNHVISHGFRRIIFCTGYRGEWIAQHFSPRIDIDAIMSHEDAPLGTAGALRGCRSLLNTVTTLVLNGDSLCRIDLRAFLAAHQGKQTVATIAVVPSNDRTDGGGVIVDEQGRILAFHEKQAGQYLNAGIYAIQTSAIDQFPESIPSSLERDIFPRLMNGGLHSYICRAPLFDIGTPARLAEFQALQRNSAKVGSRQVQCVYET
jgi:NDP-sugar pyrophosphorylase family protein